MIGSHNTMSYLKPVHWYHWFLLPWARCQNLDIDEQIKAGVTYLDIRLKYINNAWHFVHNNVDFGVEDMYVYMQSNCYYRICLDVRKKPKNAEQYEQLFYDHVNYLKKKYNIKLAETVIFWDWDVYSYLCASISERHSSVNAPWYIQLLGNKWWAKKYNKTFVKYNSIYYLVDYIQYGTISNNRQ